MNKILTCVLILIQSMFLSQSVDAQDHLIDSLRFNQSTADDIVDLLRGKVSGVHVCATDGRVSGLELLNIRGFNAVNGDNQPLIVVDGVELSSNTNMNRNAFWQKGDENYTSPLSPLAFLSTQDIESIEVLKDASATSRYGSKGANGVIVIKTRMATTESFSASVTSNIGMNFPSISHNHYLNVAANSKKTSYYVSANFRNVESNISGCNSNYGGLLAGFENKTNSLIKFGMKVNLAGGQISGYTSTAHPGKPSYTLSLRDSERWGITAYEWMTDYDDDNIEYRALISSFLQFNVTPKFSIDINLGCDFYKNQRGIWYGSSTPLGRPSIDNIHGGAAAQLSSTLLNYNADISFNYKTFFFGDHSFGVSAFAKADGENNIHGVANGFNFVNHILRAKGLNFKSSLESNSYFAMNRLRPSVLLSLAYDWKTILGLNVFVNGNFITRYGFENTACIYPSSEAYFDIIKAVNVKTPIISSLKVRGGWGKSGKNTFYPYEWCDLSLFDDMSKPASGTEVFYDGVNTLSLSEWHLSADLTMFEGRLKGSVTYYDRAVDETFNIYNLGGDPVYFQGTEYLQWVDAVRVARKTSSIRNRGCEFTLFGRILDTKTVTWDMSLNGMYNDTSYPYGWFMGYMVDDRGNFIDQTGEGRVTEHDKVLLGNSLPRFVGGLNTTLSFYGVSFFASFSSAIGHSIANVNSLPDSRIQDGEWLLDSNCVEDASYFRMDRIGVNYRLPFKIKAIRSIDFRIAARNLATITSYSGLNPNVNSFANKISDYGYDYGSYPLRKSVVLGVSVTF